MLSSETAISVADNTEPSKYERRMKEKPKLIKFTKELCRLVETMLTDNGKEFAGHKDIATALGIDVYFAHPYHSWERGANENMNGLIRQYLPKGSLFENLTDKDISFIQNRLNNRPRKKARLSNSYRIFFR